MSMYKYIYTHLITYIYMYDIYMYICMHEVNWTLSWGIVAHLTGRAQELQPRRMSCEATCGRYALKLYGDPQHDLGRAVLGLWVYRADRTSIEGPVSIGWYLGHLKGSWGAGSKRGFMLALREPM